MSPIPKPYPSDVTDEEWSLVAPYLTLMDENAPQRQHSLRELFNGLRYGIAWRAMPNDLPPWSAVYQWSQRSLAAGVFEALAQDLRAVLRVASGRSGLSIEGIDETAVSCVHAPEMTHLLKRAAIENF